MEFQILTYFGVLGLGLKGYGCSECQEVGWKGGGERWNVR